MKVRLNYPGGTRASLPPTPEAIQFSREISPQNRARQRTSMPCADTGFATAVLAAKSQLSQSVHPAGLAAARETAPRCVHIHASLKPTSVRLPAPSRDAQENRLYALLTAMCVLLIVYEVWSTLESAADWRHFVDFVRQLLG